MRRQDGEGRLVPSSPYRGKEKSAQLQLKIGRFFCAGRAGICSLARLLPRSFCHLPEAFLMSSKALERCLQNFLATQTVEAAIFCVVRIHSKNASNGRYGETTMKATTALWPMRWPEAFRGGAKQR